MRNTTRRRLGPVPPAAPDPIAHNIDAVVALHEVAERGVDAHQRGVERLTAWLGRPQFFYGILVGVGLWMGVNGLPRGLRGPHWDDPPFVWLQGLIGLLALLLTTVVLITIPSGMEAPGFRHGEEMPP
jgi:uncharacterized membrane protein